MADIIFTDDFESGSLHEGSKQQNGFFWRIGDDTEVSTENKKNGSYSLRFFFEGKEDGKDASSEQRFYLGGHHPDIWVKYDLFIPSNYVHRNSTGSDNNKGFLWLWAQGYSCKEREGPKLGSHFWPRDNGDSKVSMYATACENGEQKIQEHWLSTEEGDGKSNNGIINDDRGHWMTLIMHAKYATKANNDGVFEMWKTNWRGETDKLMNIHNGAWYSTQPNSNEPARGFDQGYLLGWANSGFDEDTIIYLDNIVFSTGPLVTDAVAAPKPPKISN